MVSSTPITNGRFPANSPSFVVDHVTPAAYGGPTALESPDNEGRLLSMLRRVARALRARVRVVLEPDSTGTADALAEDTVPCRVSG